MRESARHGNLGFVGTGVRIEAPLAGLRLARQGTPSRGPSTAVTQCDRPTDFAACLCERRWPVLLPEPGVNRYYAAIRAASFFVLCRYGRGLNPITIAG
jgi:hypothetical protein